MKQITNGTIAAVAATLALTACNDHTFVPEAQAIVASAAGVYGGTLASDPGGATEFKAIVLDDGSFWNIYGQAGTPAFSVYGFARGSGTSVEGTFSSTAGTDFGFIPPTDVSLEADYDTGAGTLVGGYTTVAGTTTFTGGPIDSGYDFTAAPDLQILVGAWDVEDPDGILYTLDVAADGSFDLTEQGGGCTGTGTFAPHAGGRNVFEISLDFDNVIDCADAGGTASGAALAYTITGALTDQLLMAVNDAGTFGMALFGTRPSP
jgi:hypothetical protein